MSTRREVDRLVREYRHKGWTVSATKSKHWRFVPPGGDCCVITASSPGNVSAINHIKADLKRCERQAAIR